MDKPGSGAFHLLSLDELRNAFIFVGAVLFLPGSIALDLLFEDAVFSRDIALPVNEFGVDDPQDLRNEFLDPLANLHCPKVYQEPVGR